jgi:hypothetical protein
MLALASVFFLNGMTRAVAHDNIPEMLDEYHSMQAALVDDDLDTTLDKAKELNLEIQDWVGDHPQSDPNFANVQAMKTAVAALLAAQPTDADAIRNAFGQISDPLIAIVRANTDLKAQWSLYFCPMVKKYWLEPAAETKVLNPYTGASMPGCGEKRPW